MNRFTISLDAALAQAFDALIAERGYANRSEAVRDLVRRELEQRRPVDALDLWCVANLSYVYNHHERALGERLTAHQHEHHQLCVSSLHAHLDHDDCMESVILRGPSPAVRRFADSIAAERGVRHSALNLVTVERAAHDHTHTHLRPRT